MGSPSNLVAASEARKMYVSHCNLLLARRIIFHTCFTLVAVYFIAISILLIVLDDCDGQRDARLVAATMAEGVMGLVLVALSLCASTYGFAAQKPNFSYLIVKAVAYTLFYPLPLVVVPIWLFATKITELDGNGKAVCIAVPYWSLVAAFAVHWLHVVINLILNK